MDWQTLAWESIDGPLLEAAAPVAEFVEILRGAVEESASALAQASITIADVSVARVAAFASVATEVEPVATFELMAAARRQVLAGFDPAMGSSLAGAGMVPMLLARAIVEGVDGAFTDLLGEGLNVGPADAATISGSEPALVVLFRLRGPDGTGVDLLGIVEEAVPAELAAHVVALQALGSISMPASRPASPVSAGGAGATSPDNLQAAADAAFAALQAEAMAAAPAASRAPAPVAAAPAFASALAPAPAQALAVSSVTGYAPAGPAIRQASFDELTPRTPERSTTSLDLLLGVNLQVTVEIGRTKLQIREILGLAPGSIVELDKLAGEPVDVLVNGRQIATGEVVVVDENFGVRITEIVSRQRRIAAGAAPAA